MPTQSSRGRPRTHWADKLRVQVWYFVLRKFSGLSDYALDLQFANPSDEPRRPADRKRIFEKIRRNGQIPSRGAHWRSAYDLIGAVDNFLPGSKEVFEAEIWGLLKTPPATLHETHTRLEQCLKDYDFKRVDWVPLLGRISHEAGYAVTGTVFHRIRPYRHCQNLSGHGAAIYLPRQALLLYVVLHFMAPTK